jgi:hypothetical protein
MCPGGLAVLTKGLVNDENQEMTQVQVHHADY